MRRVTQAMVFALLTGALGIAAQAKGGSIRGVVKDPSNDTIPGVQVTLKNKETKAVYETTTNISGQYRFDVPAGVYTVDAYLPGFARYTIAGLKLEEGGSLSREIKLEVSEQRRLPDLFHLIK
jgi:Carboxypeptidase regulatory-like domain